MLKTVFLPSTWLAMALACFLSPSVAGFVLERLVGVNIPVAYIAYVSLALLTLLGLCARFPSRQDVWTSGALIIVLAYFCLTSLWSESEQYMRSKVAFTVAIPPLMFFAGLVVGRSQSDFRQLAWSLIGLAVAISLAMLLLGRDEVCNYGDEPGAGYQSVSRMLGLGLISCWSLLWLDRGWVERILLVALTGLFGIMAVSTGGRVGIALSLAYLATVLWFSRGVPRAALLVAAGVGLILFVSPQVDTWLVNLSESRVLPESIRRMAFYLSSAGEERANDISRSLLYHMGWQVWSERPLLGTGWGGFPITAGFGEDSGLYPHNLLLELLAETGVPGFLLFLLLLVGVTLPAVRLADPRRSPFLVIALGFLVAGWVNALIIFDFPFQRELLLGMGLTVSATQVAHRERFDLQVDELDDQDMEEMDDEAVREG